jgi:polyphosphate kinase 2 (PPK2 family)
MYAYNRYSVLIGLQRMDRAGNDSLIRVVYKEMNPRGVEVKSFKTPTSAELEHDFLWRYYKVLPELQKYTDIQNHELDEEVQENIKKQKKI